MIANILPARRTAGGAFQFILTGPPGLYAGLAADDLAVWSEAVLRPTKPAVSASPMPQGTPPRGSFTAPDPIKSPTQPSDDRSLMKTITRLLRPLLITVLALASFTNFIQAQEISIPDPGPNAAVRAALQKPAGPLTQQDLLSLTNLDASSRNVGNLAGLEAAHNLTTLSLQSNHLANLSVPG